MNKTLHDLSQMISDLRVSGKFDRAEDFMNSMLYLMSQGYNLSGLAGEIIKLLPLPHLPLKKVLCAFLIRYSENISDLNILATNCLLKDFSDANPHIRRLAVKTVCSIPCLRELSLELLPKALSDPSVHVRQTAALYCTKVIEISNDANHDVIDKLYSMIRDPDVMVMSNCLIGLEEILSNEGGIVVNRKIAEHLANSIVSLPEWSFVIVCKILKKYKPKDEEELVYFLNILDDKLTSRNPAVFIPIAELAFLLVKENYPSLEVDVIDQISGNLLLLLNDCSSEILLAVLEIIQSLALKHKKPFAENINLFFCRFIDADYVKVKKLSTLPLLVTDENICKVTEEIFTHCTNQEEIASQAISSYFTVLNMKPEVFHKEMERLRTLMCLNSDFHVEIMVLCLSKFNFSTTAEMKKSILEAVSEQYYQIKSIKGKIALLIIISEHGDSMPSASYILEQFFSQEDKDANESLYIILLMAAVRLFLIQPAQMQLLLGQILWEASKSLSPLVRNKAIFYYNLLKSDVNLAVRTLTKSPM